MTISIFDLFSVGIGPSSSHTVGPMRAAAMFVGSLDDTGLLTRTARVRVELFGSLGATGHGHGSVKAVVLGLEGERPEIVDPRTAQPRVDRVQDTGRLWLKGKQEIGFTVDDVVMHRRRTLPFHANGMTFQAFDADGAQLDHRTYYSVGGGFVVSDEPGGPRVVADPTPVAFAFSSGKQLMEHCERKWELQDESG